MNFSIPQKDLEAASNVLSGVVDRASGPQPVLGNFLVEATEAGLQFRGTDSETLVVVNLNASIGKLGRTTVPSDTFREIVRAMPPQGEVTVNEVDSRVTVSCESNEFKITTIPADEFPEYHVDAGLTRFQLSQKVLKYLIESTVYALPTKDHRRVLLGVFFELNDNRLRLTATDGKKLARVSAPVPEVEGVSNAAIVVPRKLLDNLVKVLGNEGPVEVELSSRQIALRFGNVQYRTNGIDGKYPDCEAVIPREFPIDLPLNRDVFLQASRRAGITTDEKSKSIILKFENNNCHFESMSHDVGAFKGRISIDYTGPTLELAFNFQFLIETLSRFSKPEVRLLIKNSTAPVVVKAVDEPDRLALLMPIKLSDARPAPPPVDND